MAVYVQGIEYSNVYVGGVDLANVYAAGARRYSDAPLVTDTWLLYTSPSPRDS